MHYKWTLKQEGCSVCYANDCHLVTDVYQPLERKDKKMLKRELVNKVAEQLGEDFFKQDLTEAVDIILEEISEALTSGRRVEIRGFGSFSVRTRKPRVTKNPKTGILMHIPARKTLHFTMSKSLKDVLIEE